MVWQVCLPWWCVIIAASVTGAITLKKKILERLHHFANEAFKKHLHKCRELFSRSICQSCTVLIRCTCFSMELVEKMQSVWFIVGMQQWEHLCSCYCSKQIHQTWPWNHHCFLAKLRSRENYSLFLPPSKGEETWQQHFRWWAIWLQDTRLGQLLKSAYTLMLHAILIWISTTFRENKLSFFSLSLIFQASFTWRRKW